MNNHRKTNPYRKELLETLREIKHDNESVKSLDYFINATYRFFNDRKENMVKPEVVILGSSIPEEILFAMGITPLLDFRGELEYDRMVF